MLITAKKNFSGGGLAEGADQWENSSPVASFAANSWGLHDMHGNVWEWVQDHWHENYEGAPDTGEAWTTGGDPAKRVLRGGSWDLSGEFIRSASRGTYPPDFRYFVTGFRIVCTPQ